MWVLARDWTGFRICGSGGDAESSSSGAGSGSCCRVRGAVGCFNLRRTEKLALREAGIGGSMGGVMGKQEMP